MSSLAIGVVATAPGTGGMGAVVLGDETRRVWFSPTRFAAPWPLPTVGARVMVDTTPAGGREPHALWLLGAGAPTYVYGGA